jgi:hypothetical protein
LKEDIMVEKFKKPGKKASAVAKKKTQPTGIAKAPVIDAPVIKPPVLDPSVITSPVKDPTVLKPIVTNPTVIRPTITENPLTNVNLGVTFAKTVTGLFQVTAIRDNTPFIIKFDPDTLARKVTRSTRAIVVNQDPAPGDLVPGGTPVSVTLVVKDEIPLGTFKGINESLAGKYTFIGQLQADLENPEDPVANEAKVVLDKNAEYNALSSGDKLAIGTFISQRFGDQAIVSEDQKAKVYEDIKFLRNI